MQSTYQFLQESKFKISYISLLYDKYIGCGYVNGTIEIFSYNPKPTSILTLSIFSTEITDIYNDPLNRNILLFSSKTHLCKYDISSKKILGLIPLNDYINIIHLPKSLLVSISKSLIQVWDTNTLTLLSQYKTHKLCDYCNVSKVYGSKIIFEVGYNGKPIDIGNIQYKEDFNCASFTRTIVHTEIPEDCRREYAEYDSSSDEEVENEIDTVPIIKEDFSFETICLNYNEKNDFNDWMKFWNRDKRLVKRPIIQSRKLKRKEGILYQTKIDCLSKLDPAKYFYRYALDKNASIDNKEFNRNGLLIENLNGINCVCPNPNKCYEEKLIEMISTVYIPIENYTLMKQTKFQNHLVVLDVKNSKCFNIMTIDKDNLGDKLIRLNRFRYAFIHKDIHLLLLDLNNYSCKMLIKKEMNPILSVNICLKNTVAASTKENLLLWDINNGIMIKMINLNLQLDNRCFKFNEDTLLIVSEGNDKKSIVYKLSFFKQYCSPLIEDGFFSLDK